MRSMRQGKGIAARTYDDREETSSEEEEPVYEHEGARIREKKGAALSCTYLSMKTSVI